MQSTLALAFMVVDAFNDVDFNTVSPLYGTAHHPKRAPSTGGIGEADRCFVVAVAIRKFTGRIDGTGNDVAVCFIPFSAKDERALAVKKCHIVIPAAKCAVAILLSALFPFGAVDFSTVEMIFKNQNGTNSRVDLGGGFLRS